MAHQVPTLHTQHLILRSLTAADAPDVFAYAADLEVARFTQWQAHETMQDTHTFIASTHAYTQLNQSLLWGIEYKKERKIVGECGFVFTTDQQAEIYYALAKNYWGNGFATQAVERLIAFGFESLHLQRLEAWIIADNIASHRVAQKVGMRCKTILYNHWQADSLLHNIYIYSCERPASSPKKRRRVRSQETASLR